MPVDRYGNPIFATEPLTALTGLTLPTAAAATTHPLQSVIDSISTPTSGGAPPLQSLLDSISAPKLASVPTSNTLSLLLGALGNRAGAAAATSAGVVGGPTHRSAQKLLVRGKYAVPAKGKVIGTPYGGTHTLGNWESDNAVDISLPVGTPLRATADGVIGSSFGSLNSKNPRMQGLRLHLDTKGNEFYYAHLSSFAKGIKPGVQVKEGQIIGYSGSANGTAHLHLGVRTGDPLGLYK